MDGEKILPGLEWVINVSGYGAFLFVGSEAEAETMRAHKSRHEGGLALKRRATVYEVSNERPSTCWKRFDPSRYCECTECTVRQLRAVSA